MSKASQIRQKAQEYLRKGNISKAIDEYKRLISVENKNPNLFNELGDVFLRAGDRVQAVSNYDKAIVNYEKVALYNNAVAVCKKILRTVPNRVDTLFKLGALRAKQKLDGEAVSYFSKFMDVVLADSTSQVEGLTDKLDEILSYYEKNEMLCSRAADLFNMYGLKSKAAEMYVKLTIEYKKTGNVERERYYLDKFEAIKKDLEENEIADFDALLQGDSQVEAMFNKSKVPGREESVKPRKTPGAGTAQKEENAEKRPIAVDEEEKDRGVPSSQGGGNNPNIEEVIEETEIISAIEDSEVSSEDDFKSADTEDKADEVSSRAFENEQAEAKDEGDQEKDIPFSSAMDKESISSGKDQSAGMDGLVEEITSDVEEEDHKSHYDLGMAYLEMGLYNEAVKEFQTASRSDALNLQCMEMIGYCFIKKERPRLAVKQLVRALSVSNERGTDNLGIHYNLGIAYEMLGDADKAKEHFEEVYIVDMSFRDVEEKMKKYSTVT